jgi:hypothetical protein
MGQESAKLAAVAVSSDGLRDVTILTGETEADGHGFYIDDKSIAGAMQALLGKSAASYLTHDGADGDRLGQEIGFFSGIYRDGLKLKAKTFSFLESFKRESGAVADRLLEMAQKFPDQFGLSPAIRFRPVWVMGDGSEMPAKMGEKAPAGAVRAIPSARIASIKSIDFVKNPAANPNGLLSADSAPVDAGNQKQASNMSQEISAALEAQKKDLTETHAAALSAAVYAALAKKEDEHKAALAALTAAKDEEKNAAVSAALSAADLTHKAALAKVEADSAAALKVEEDARLQAESLSAAKLGIPPLVLAHAANAIAALPAPAKTDAEKWDQFTELAKADPAKAENFRKAYLSK